VSPGFLRRQFSLTTGGVPTPARSFPCCGKTINNHVSLGVPPPNMDTATPCHVEGHPSQIRSIEPFTLVNSPPGQVEDASSHMVNSPLCQVGSILANQKVYSPSPWQLSARTSRNVSRTWQLSAVSSRGLSSQIKGYRALTLSTLRQVKSRSVFAHGQLSAMSRRGLSSQNQKV